MRRVHSLFRFLILAATLAVFASVGCGSGGGDKSGTGGTAGSGGAILGLYKDGRQYQQLSDALAAIRCNVLRPLIFDS